jgi:N-acetylglucosaminyldiphosphoundecaprenol N-acetyl-beta-D-mannosaminyltransferase
LFDDIEVDRWGNNSRLKSAVVLGVGVSSVTLSDVLSIIEDGVNQRNGNMLVFPLNVDVVMKAQEDNAFRQVLNDGDLVLADGYPVFWAAGLLGKGPGEKVSGSDLLPILCNLSATNKYSIFFLGAGPGVAEKAIAELKKEYRELQVAGAYSPPMTFDSEEKEHERAVEIVRSANPDILFVGLGAPKQERFLCEHRRELNVPVSIAVGATFDFVAGKVRRAPFWMQRVGLEWAWRLYQEPKRLWRRYLVDDMPFFWHVLKQKMSQLRSRNRDRGQDSKGNARNKTIREMW